MSLATVLVLTYFLNGSIQNTTLETTSYESCVSDMHLSEEIVRALGGTVLASSCVTRRVAR